MECRDVRPLIGSIATLTTPTRRTVEAHLAGCPACRDEFADPVMAVLAGVRLSMAQPPSEITQRVLLRLPAAAPVELRQREGLVQRRNSIAAGTLIAGAAVALSGIVLLDLLSIGAADVIPSAGLALALLAKALLIVAGQPWLAGIALLGALAAALLSAWNRRVRGGSPTPELAAGALAVLLAVNAVGVREDRAAIVRPLMVQDRVAGDVVALGQDITVRGEVLGDVVSMAGTITLEPGAHVHGSVLAGTGTNRHPEAAVDQALFDPLANLPMLARVLGDTAPAARPAVDLAPFAGLIVVMLCILIGALLVISWPQRAAQASIHLRHNPGRALLYGLAATVGLSVVTLGGGVLLAATVVGVLLIPVLLLLCQLPYVTGIAVVGQLL
jgi:hypothetical protein